MNVKKILCSVLLALLTAVAAWGEDADESFVEDTIRAAGEMSLAELEAAAKAELETKSGLIFNADSLTSGVKRALAAFEAKYPWASGRTAYHSKKGSEYQHKLTYARKTGDYIADFVMIQDASFLKNAMLDTGFLLSYSPSGSEFRIDPEDRNPQVGVTFSKIFIYDNRIVGPNQIKNVWQMTGVDGVSLKAVRNVSFQTPLGEDVNMNFLVMLTSESYCQKLKDAYRSYFGKDYDPNAEKEGYENIGYKFVAEFLKNVGYWHTSDTQEIMKLDSYAQDGRIIFAGLNKLKDYEYFKPIYDNTDKSYVKTMTASGWNSHIEGFDGFIYNMWTLIPRTAKLPYTACLFIRFLLSEEGFQAGWGGAPGYYSSNQNNRPTVPGDPELSVWKKQCVVEDIHYLQTAYITGVKFINMRMAGW